MSTVREEISGQTLANEVRLQSAVHSGSFLLVEGSKDSILFQRFCDASACVIIVCLGRERLHEAISILERSGFAGVLGYCDRDHFDLVGYPSYEGVIVYTDENDVEIQILHSDALDAVLREFGVPERIAAQLTKEGRPICELLTGWAAPLGALRLASSVKDWALKFEGMTYKFVDVNSPEIDWANAVRHVCGRSDRSRFANEDSVRLAAEDILSRFSAREISNGHDCIAILGKALKRRLGSTNRFHSVDGCDLLEKVLRLAYGIEAFRKTRGFLEIRRWETATGYVVLKDA